MSRNIIIVVILLVLVVGFFLLTRNSTPLSTTTGPENISTASASPTASPASPSAMTQNLITVTSAGFSPASITIKAGDTITWKNTGTENHTVNSDPHPTHTLYPILNTVGLLQPGEEKPATFAKAGTYTYHDHLHPSSKGTIIVQ